ncbi:DUF6191 domain-containing protein [Streptomyces sp. NPDC002889]|uniref:DUF6191 domain-containing protein n=1 Tax=Streptomyces sp. NPDC002889 TaxID=3364669 RepID=UPI003693E66A
MFNVLEECFAPARKHTDEERNRLALTRVDVGDNDPARGPIDLASGKVTVRVTGDRPHGGQVQDGGTRDDRAT